MLFEVHFKALNKHHEQGSYYEHSGSHPFDLVMLHFHYMQESNPLPEEHVSSRNTGESKKRVFQERMRAERESFRSVFDKRRQRIGGLALEDE